MGLNTDNTMVKGKGQTIQWSKEKEKRTNNDLQNTTQKTKDQVTRYTHNRKIGKPNNLKFWEQ